MENSWFSKSEESRAGLIKCQDHVDSLLFYANRITHKEFVPSGQTANQRYYLKVLKWLRDLVRGGGNRPEMWSSGDWFVYHDNAPAQTALSVQQFLVKQKHDSYPSSDLATCDFFLFAVMKGQFKRKLFADVREVQKKTQDVLNSISSKEFQKCLGSCDRASWAKYEERRPTRCNN